jgi:proline iminopeptidase
MHSSIDLYPPIDPYASGFLEVSALHSIYWEQCGNPSGIPVLIIHGGPGEGCSPTHRRFFDPNIFRIILFDQRGCGRSSPHGALQENTPALLVDDINTIRKHLDIDSWHVFGGSWGSTLAFLYALENPSHVKSMILRGIFLFQKKEIDWFLYGIKSFFPKTWGRFTAHLSTREQKDILKCYYSKLTHKDPAIQKDAAVDWFTYESTCATLSPNKSISIHEEHKPQALAMARIEAHYFKYHTMDGKNALLKQLPKIKHIPLTIVQGRYDIICPPVSAQSVIDIWDNAQYYLVDNAGHSMMDPEIKNKLLTVTYNLAEHYKNTEEKG